jgi:hypothetical protein
LPPLQSHKPSITHHQTAQISPDLYNDLAASKLLIFKGDLNYRKLAYDCRWPLDAPFADALGPFRPAPLVTLRTLKADVMAGLAPGQGAALDKIDKEWQVNGKYGIVGFAHEPGRARMDAIADQMQRG